MDESAFDLDAVRVATVQVPSFVTPDFLRRVMPLTNRDLRMIHDRYGTVFNDITGFAWPKEKPAALPAVGHWKH